VAIAQVAGASGTLAAVVVALWITVRDGRRIRAEQADRDDRQARLVTFEVYRRGDRWRVGTTNQSMAPIFEVTVTAVARGERVGHIEAVPGSPARLTLVPAGGRVEQTITFAEPEPPPIPDVTTTDEMINSYQVTAHFLDAAGLRWSRTGSDPPQRILSKTTTSKTTT
jgi:hypothetical protein